MQSSPHFFLPCFLYRSPVCPTYLQYLVFVSRQYHYVSWHRTSAQLGSLDLYSNVESNKMRALKINWRILSIQILLFKKKLKKIKSINLLFPLLSPPTIERKRKNRSLQCAFSHCRILMDLLCSQNHEWTPSSCPSGRYQPIFDKKMWLELESYWVFTFCALCNRVRFSADHQISCG